MMPQGAQDDPQASAQQEKARLSGLFFRVAGFGTLVATMLYPPLLGIAVGAGLLFGLSARDVGTFGGEVGLAAGLLAWWAALLVPSLVYAFLTQD
jgi:hypothetical protein